MKHFSIAEWTDYARHLTPSAASARMKAHLDSGCGPCAATLRRLEQMVEVIAGDSSREVPEYVVRNAKSIFALRRPEKMKLSTVIARLVHDSFRQPLPAGVRTRQRSIRHAVYQAGDYRVDVRLDSESSGKVNLVGQVAQCTDPAAAMANVCVYLLAGRKVIGQAISNEYGEFHFEYQPTQQVRLHVPVEAAGKPIEVRLHDLSGGGSGGGDPVAAEPKAR